MDSGLLITPAGVVELAFTPGHRFSESAVPESAILTAQEKFVRPVVGKLYDELLEGKHTDLLERYIRPALAMYVRYSLIPHSACSLGEYGLTMPRGDTLRAASPAEVSAYRKTVRAEALVLMKRAVSHIEANPALYPSYNPDDNILNRTGIVSGFVL